MVTNNEISELKVWARLESYPKGESSSICSVPRTQSEQDSFFAGAVSSPHASISGAQKAFEELFGHQRSRNVDLMVGTSPVSFASIIVSEE